MPKAKKTVSGNGKSNGRVYGWVPDLPDHRDYLYNAFRRVPPGLPPRIDLRPFCSAVEDQGALGCCTANALVAALEFLELRDRVYCADLSRLFIYYNERVIKHTVGSDSGATLRDGIKTLSRQGVCTEHRWPYMVSRFAKRPSAACYREAGAHQITSYHRLLTIDEMRTCLAEGYPFVFGFTASESFESRKTARTGIVNLPKPGERVFGGHAVAAVGYDDTDRRFIVRNSWGSAWGMEGYCTMPYEYLEDRNLSDDFWTIRRGEKM